MHAYTGSLEVPKHPNRKEECWQLDRKDQVIGTFSHGHCPKGTYFASSQQSHDPRSRHGVMEDETVKRIQNACRVLRHVFKDTTAVENNINVGGHALFWRPYRTLADTWTVLKESDLNMEPECMSAYK